jgi:hypothetical protein
LPVEAAILAPFTELLLDDALLDLDLEAGGGEI